MIPPPLWIRAVCDGACALAYNTCRLRSVINRDGHSASRQRRDAWSKEVGG